MSGPPRHFSAVLATGDLCCLMLFAILGRRNHHEAATLAAVARTAAPFLVALPLAALPLRSWHYGSGIKRAALTWACAWPIALGLRAALGRDIPVAFAVVALLVPMAMIVAWRSLAMLLARRLEVRP